ncbi:hypothetical protein [Actinorugispora endophytica]|uniref:Secreted protein n=1 Tax=Actinorugispora endophytica TaxID=1605990 RepID=A0A4R6V7W5_9ACTN|nr:hypothetical protein [Actinorugispora endophytica]TDQ54828.1 hypothetical protein EV190_101144 [Actinorugispora endophytica]
MPHAPYAWMRVGTAAAVVAAVLAAPPQNGEAGADAGDHRAEEGWIREDLAAADRWGAVLHPDGIGAGAERRSGDTGSSAALALFPSHRLDRSTGAVEVAVDATGADGDLVVEARGTRADGAWTEWREAADPGSEGGGRVALPAEVDRVQVRVGMGADPGARVGGVRTRPVEGAAESLGPAGEPYSARLFATRVGLVGHRTANGGTIRPDAHFVALPSRRGLSAKGGGEYTVRVCTTDAEPRRCAYAPVWDVGPWNTKDDHWNTDRQMWTDLPQGTPQAEAAYLDGYNDGLDGFGREVRNPAGIDLADGTFRHALRLPTNAWVQVDYLWTGSYTHLARVRSADGEAPVAVRSGPGARSAETGLAAHNANVDVLCRTDRDGADGVWYHIGEGHYIPAENADGGDTAPWCGT